MTESTETTAPQLPYVSWGSMKNFLDRLREAGSVPGRIDRGFLGGSGAYQSQMLHALKFLGLIGGDSRTTDALRALALADDEGRKPFLAEVVQERYADLLALGTDATQMELEAVIRDHGLSGDTVRKAASLFLSAAKYAEVPVSAWWKVGKPVTVNGKRKVIRRTKTGAIAADQMVQDRDEVEVEVLTPPAPPPGAAGSTTIPLASGGSLTFSYSVDLMVMSREDRNFVFQLIDQMQEYRQATSAAHSPVVGDADDDLDADEEE
jgi:hypothetical protein